MTEVKITNYVSSFVSWNIGNKLISQLFFIYVHIYNSPKANYKMSSRKKETKETIYIIWLIIVTIIIIPLTQIKFITEKWQK
jgi:hypothetical protein